MLKFTCLLLLSFGIMMPVTAQRQTIHQLNLEDTYSGEAIQATDLRKRGTEGSHYWSDEWMPGAVLMGDEKIIEGYLLKYDIENWTIDVDAGYEIKAIPGEMVKEFTMGPKGKLMRFVSFNVHFEPQKLDDHRGFYELIVEGKLSLMRRMDTEVLKPNYVPALDAGNINAQIIKKEKLFVYDGKGLHQIPKNKGKALDLFRRHLSGLDSYVKSQKINPKKLEDLISLVNHCNAQP